MQNKKLPFSPPFYGEEEQEAVLNCIKTKWTGTGPKTKEFEELFSKYKESKYAAAVSSCTSALYLSLKALGIKEGDEVITTSMTFCSTVNVIIHTGAKPVLCDIDPTTKNIDPNKIEDLITSKTRCLLVVHYAGLPCDMDAICKIVDKYNLYLVEDCAHAIESKYKNQHCGTFGDVGCFSFYATKNIAIGEGGMVISEHSEIVSKVARLALHGLSRDAWRRFESASKKPYDVIEIGHKMNLTDLQSSIGIVQLAKIEQMRERRKEIWYLYLNELKDCDLNLPNEKLEDESVHSMHLFTCGLPEYIDRDDFIWRMSNKHNIVCGIHYNSIPSYSAYKSLIYEQGGYESFPNANKWGRSTISLSLSASVSNEDVERIINSVKKEIQN